MSTLDPAMSYVITEFDPRDAEPMIALWTANLRGYDRARAQAKLRLGYVENPAGGSVLLALLADGTAAPQGSVGLNARRMHLGPRCIHAVTAVDFVVNIEHRSKGLAMRLLRECARIAAERLEFCYGMPNANAAPAFVAAQFRKLGAFERFVKPLRGRRFVGRHVPDWIGRFLAPVVDLALLAADRVRELRLPARVECRDAGWDDPALDALWRQRPASLLLSERTRDLLAWRFATTGRSAWRVSTFHDSGGVVRGYAVWQIAGNVVEVGDSFCPEPQWAGAQMLALSRRVRALDGPDSISFQCLAAEPMRRRLRGAGMVPRPEQRFVFVDTSSVAATLAEDAWYMTNFDEDTD